MRAKKVLWPCLQECKRMLSFPWFHHCHRDHLNYLQQKKMVPTTTTAAAASAAPPSKRRRRRTNDNKVTLGFFSPAHRARNISITFGFSQNPQTHIHSRICSTLLQAYDSLSYASEQNSRHLQNKFCSIGVFLCIKYITDILSTMLCTERAFRFWMEPSPNVCVLETNWVYMYNNNWLDYNWDQQNECKIFLSLYHRSI